VSAIDSAAPFDPYRLGRGGDGDLGQAGGPAPKRVIVAYGFWIFLLSDIVMFSAFFASYAVLAGATAHGPTGRQIFDLGEVAAETACLLLSSFSCGMAAVATGARNKTAFYLAMIVTFVLGAIFITLEVREFIGLIEAGDGPSRSAFLSAFFALVGCHGAHVSAGLLWLLTMIAQVYAKGFRAEMLRRILCFNLFWHALDIIWVAVFTVVYLLAGRP